MSGLKSRKGFVGNGRDRKSRAKWEHRTILVTILLVFVVLMTIVAAMYIGMAFSKSSHISQISTEVSKNSEYMLGKGGATPHICYGNNTFIMLWYGEDPSGNWMLNGTRIDVYGNLLSTTTLTTDLAIYKSKPSGEGPKMVYDQDDSVFFMIWYSANKSLDGMFLNSTLAPLTGRMVLNSTINVDYHAFGLSYIGNSSFLVVWNNNKYNNYYRIIKYTKASPILGPVLNMSTDTHHSHLNDVAAYDPTTGNIMIVWRNSTEKSGDYNITGKLFNNTMNKIIKNDFTIANGYGKDLGFDMPAIASGDGKFMVVYANRNSPYTIYGKIINASNGEILSNITIGGSYYGIKYYGMGVAYNGSGGFIVLWLNNNKNVVATLFSWNGTKVAETQITNTTNSEESPRVAVGYLPTRASNVVYQFAWYDYSTKEIYTANYGESTLVPEFNVLLPVFLVLTVAIIIWKRKN